MNKKTFKIILFSIAGIVLLFILILGIMFINYLNNKNELDDYNLPKENQFILYEEYDKLMETLLSNGTYYLYIGKPNCPWCQEYVPIYNEIAKDKNKNIICYNADRIKGTVEYLNDDGTITLSLTKEYDELIKFLATYDESASLGYWKYRIIADSKNNLHTLKWLYVPGLFKIENGKVTDFLGTVKGHIKDKNGTLRNLTEEEKNNFENDLLDFFS